MKRSMWAAAVAVVIAFATLPAYAARPGAGAGAKPAAAAGPKSPKAGPVKGPSPAKPGKPPVRADRAPRAPKTSTSRATKPPKTTGPSRVEKAARIQKAPKVAKAPRVEKAAKAEKAPKAGTTTDARATTGERAVKREAASDSSRAPVPLTPLQQKLQKNTRLAAKLESRLPAGTDLMTASEGFRNLGQFVAAVNVSNNLGIPFADLKARMVTDGQSLGGSIQSLKPAADARAVASRAESDARVLIAQTEATPSATQGGSTTATADATVTTKTRTKTRTETRTKTKVAPAP